MKPQEGRNRRHPIAINSKIGNGNQAQNGRARRGKGCISNWTAFFNLIIASN